MENREMKIIAEKEGNKEGMIYNFSRIMVMLEEDSKEAHKQGASEQTLKGFDYAIEWVEGRKNRLEDEVQAIRQVVTALGLNVKGDYNSYVHGFFQNTASPASDLINHPVYTNAHHFFITWEQVEA